MNAPQIIRTSSGEELVVLSRSDYEALLARAEEAAEDAEDEALGLRLAEEIAAGMHEPLPPRENAAFLRRHGIIRAARRASGMTQVELAEKAGLTQGALSDIESGRRTGGKAALARIADALGMPRDQIAP